MNKEHKSAVQDWVSDLTLMQQSVLLTALRGPDGIDKNHVSKLLIRWLRRCVLIGAFEGVAFINCYELGGGSFTGPSIHTSDYRYFYYQRQGTGRMSFPNWREAMNSIVSDYLQTVDELPHHFQLHFMHAAEIIGYKHPDGNKRSWWRETYFRLANDMHLVPESEVTMDRRLGDKEADWRAAEEVTALGPTTDVAIPPVPSKTTNYAKPYMGRIKDWHAGKRSVYGTYVDHNTLHGKVGFTSTVLHWFPVDDDGNREIETVNSRYTLIGKSTD